MMNQPEQSKRIRFPLVAFAALSLLGALWAALVRVGWNLPALPIPIAGQHGPLMISGFLGTLIGVERAVALNRRWAYLAPLLSALGGLALLAGLSPWLGRGLLVLGALGLTLVYAIRMYQLRTAAYALTMGLGALLWLAGNLLWWFDWATYRVVPWWAGFLVLTIAGERLELARILRPGHASRIVFMSAIGVFLAGLITSLVNFEQAVTIGGMGLLALGLWLLRHDVTRRTIHQSGLTRFIAACLLPGYMWLIVSGGLWVAFGTGYTRGMIYDAMLHSLFLGFVFSMIFAHAPIILPAVLNIPIAYRPAFYAHLALLHTSLVVRVGGDLVTDLLLRRWAGLLNVIAVLLFMVSTLRSVQSQPGKSI